MKGLVVTVGLIEEGSCIYGEWVGNCRKGERVVGENEGKNDSFCSSWNPFLTHVKS